jgi:hypothetical protein
LGVDEQGDGDVREEVEEEEVLEERGHASWGRGWGHGFWLVSLCGVLCGKCEMVCGECMMI